MCAGINGYCIAKIISAQIACIWAWSNDYIWVELHIGTHHEGFEIGAPPLGEAIADLPFVVYAVRGVELAGVSWGCEAVVEAAFEAVDFVFAGFEVVAGAGLGGGKGGWYGMEVEWVGWMGRMDGPDGRAG
jgi:hypothetical protein